MRSRKKEKMDFSTKVLIFMFILSIALIVTEHIFYWFKGGYPVEVFVACVPPFIAEIVCLCKLTLDKRKYQNEEGQG